MYTNPRDRFNNEQLVQAIMQVDADLAEGNEQLDDWTEELPDSEAADILTAYTPNNELNSLLGYIAPLPQRRKRRHQPRRAYRPLHQCQNCRRTPKTARRTAKAKRLVQDD